MFEKYTEKQKAEILDEISGHYFNRNFGSMSKSDFELLLFHSMLEYLKAHEPENYSDYRLSKTLGISQTRIRNMKVKAELVYPHQDLADNWKYIFQSYIKYAKYDENTGLVKMNIPDVIVLTELRNYMEENNWYDEYQLNPKLFQCRLDIFLELSEKVEDREFPIDEETKGKLKKLEFDSLNSTEKEVLNLLKNGYKKEAIKKFGKKLTIGFIKEVLKCVPFGSFAQVLLEAITE